MPQRKKQQSRNDQRDSYTPIGFVAMTRLLRVAALDRRVTGTMLRCLVIVASHADKNGECFPSISKIARLRGVTRQAIQQQLLKVEALGYFNSERQIGPNRRETTKLYKFDLDIGVREIPPLPFSPTATRKLTTTHTGSKPMKLAPGGKRHGLAQNRHKLRKDYETTFNGKTKQKAWQGRKLQEAASRLDARHRSEMGKEGYQEFLDKTSAEDYEQMLQEEMSLSKNKQDRKS